MTFTLDNMPAGYVSAYVTATVVTLDESGEGNHQEGHGWVNDIGDTDIEITRNYVFPLFNVPTDDEDLRDMIAETLENLGAYEDNSNGTYYGQSETTDNDGNVWTYAVHFKVKHRNPKASSIFDSYTETGLLVV